MFQQTAPFKRLTSQDRRLHVLPDSNERIKPLQRLKSELQKIQEDYASKLYDLERKYDEEAQKYYKKREEIINGSYEPKIVDCEQRWKKQKDEIDLKIFEDFYKKAQRLPYGFDGKTVPDFWLRILTISDTISQIIFKPDIEALKALTDIKIVYDNSSFTLEFHFRENNFFENSVLTKTYWLRAQLDENDNPFDFEGYRIFKCRGCWINWKNWMNLTLKLAYEKNGRQKIVTCDSFFNFFNPPTGQDVADVDDETREILNLHFEIGNFFREEIIPKAMLYFTGDLADDLVEEEKERDVDSDEDSVAFIMECNDKHFQHIGRTLRRVFWSR